MPVTDGAIKAPTLAAVIARRLEDEIVSTGWPVGQVMGSETELLERFGVSRAVLREAVRIVEYTGAARMRRGPGGGLVITAPNRSAAVAALGVWFSYVGVSVVEMFEAHVVGLEGACQLAAASAQGRRRARALAARIDQTIDRDLATLEEIVEIESEMANLTDNPVLSLLVESVAELGLTRLRAGFTPGVTLFSPSDSRSQLALDRAITLAVADGNPELAGSFIRDRFVESQASMGDVALIEDRGASMPQFIPAVGGKLAEGVARELRDEIERSGWPVGRVVGSESELIDRFGVGRAILREAVRILEYQGVVRTKRGPKGGVIVAAPDSGMIVRSTRMVLEFEGVTAANLTDARSIVEVASARLAATRTSDERTIRLREILESEVERGDAARSFTALHHAIAESTGNRLLGLFVDVMAELVPPHVQPERLTASALATLSAEVQRAHANIVEAIASQDPDLAARRMLRHMRASIEVLR